MKRFPLTLARAVLVLGCAGILACGSTLTEPDAAAAVPRALREFIHSGAGTVLEPGFAKYAFGNIAEGLYRRTLTDPALKKPFTPLVAALVRTLIAQAPAGTQGLTRFGDHGNYLANLNLALGAYKKITGQDDYRDLNKRITRHLAERSAISPYHCPSYPGAQGRWPADQAFVLYTIRLFDDNYAVSYSAPLYARWKEFIVSGRLDGKTGLPLSEITGGAGYAKRPRGCALSYMILYVAKLDHAQAAVWWAAYKKYFLKDYLIAAGFRETADEKFQADADSGPIVDGVGAAATAFGIGAARCLGDDTLAAKLERLIALGKEEAARRGGKAKAAAEDIVAQAIEFNMRSQSSVR